MHACAHTVSSWQCKICSHSVHLQNRCSASLPLKLFLQDCIIYILPHALEMIMMHNRTINRLKLFAAQCVPTHEQLQFSAPLYLSGLQNKNTQTMHRGTIYSKVLQLHHCENKWKLCQGAADSAGMPSATKCSCRKPRSHWEEFLLKICAQVHFLEKFPFAVSLHLIHGSYTWLTSTNSSTV